MAWGRSPPSGWPASSSRPSTGPPPAGGRVREDRQPAGSRADLAAGRPIRLNLGVGRRPRDGYYGLDWIEMPGVDLVADLNWPLSELPDNSVAAVYLPAHDGARRWLSSPCSGDPPGRGPGGAVDVVVPHFSNPYGFSDPTHVRFFGLYTFHYFVGRGRPAPRKVPISTCRSGSSSNRSVTLMPTLSWSSRSDPGWREGHELSVRLRTGTSGPCADIPGRSIRYQLRVEKYAGGCCSGSVSFR